MESLIRLLWHAMALMAVERGVVTCNSDCLEGIRIGSCVYDVLLSICISTCILFG